MGRVHPDRYRRQIATALAVLATCCVLVLTWGALGTPQGQVVDNLGRPGRTPTGRAAYYSVEYLTVISNGFVVAAVAALLLVALAQRRWQGALGALVIVAGANVTTQALKALITRPDFGIDVGAPNSLPSGHTTVAASLGTAALLVAPTRWRPAVAVLAAGYAGSMGAATLYGGWHRPSDALTAIGVVAGWTLAVFAALPLTSAIDAEHALHHSVEPDEPDALPARSSAHLAAVRLLSVGAALGSVVAVVGLMLLVGGWTGAGTMPLFRYAGPAGAVVAAGCLMAWASVVLAPPPVDRLVRVS